MAEHMDRKSSFFQNYQKYIDIKLLQRIRVTSKDFTVGCRARKKF